MYINPDFIIKTLLELLSLQTQICVQVNDSIKSSFLNLNLMIDASEYIITSLPESVFLFFGSQSV